MPYDKAPAPVCLRPGCSYRVTPGTQANGKPYAYCASPCARAHRTAEAIATAAVVPPGRDVSADARAVLRVFAALDATPEGQQPHSSVWEEIRALSRVWLVRGRRGGRRRL